MLDNSGIGSLFVRIIHRRISLEVRNGKFFHLESYFSIFKCSEAIVIVGINCSRENHLFGLAHPFFLIREKVRAKFYRNTFQHLLHHDRIAIYGNALIECIEIVIIISESHGKSSDNGCGKFFTVPSPLLLGISLDELLVNFFSDKGNRLLFQILRLDDSRFPSFFLNLFGSFFRCNYPPHRIKSVHVKRKRIDFPLVISYRRIRKAVKFRKLIHILPYFCIVGMENVRTVMMHHNPVFLIRIHISANVFPLIDDQNLPSSFLCLMRKYRSEKPRTNHKIIQVFHAILLYS